MKKTVFLTLALLAASVSGTAAWEVSGYVEAEGRYFFQSPQYADQAKDSGSVAAEPELYHEWKGGASLTFTPFYRYDSADEERTHFDVREAMFLLPRENYEIRAGVGKVFWGVTEAAHLVDIINQTDLVESVDGEEKLGQPMLNLTLLTGVGTLDFFILPYFRPRTFQGSGGRLRFEPPVKTADSLYENIDKERNVDYAARYSVARENWDIGVSHFYGTGREPAYLLTTAGKVVSYYEIINQTGLDLQYVNGAWLWKFEGIYRSGLRDGDFYAIDAGFEYTLPGAYLPGMEVGLVVEYLYDGRDFDKKMNEYFASGYFSSRLNSFYNNDYMLALRIALSDAASSEALLGIVRDLDNGSGTFLLEASRRLGDNFKASLESYMYINPEKDLLLNYLKVDEFLQISLRYYF